MLSGTSNACNKRLSQQLFGEAGTPRIAIIGGGFGGIGLGVKLVEAGIETFTIFEKNETFGGTWWENTYPGAEVDSPSYLYSYSFRPYDWSRNFARQPELLEYMSTVIEEHELLPRFEFNTNIESVVWDEDAHEYEVHTSTGERSRFHVVVSAVGLLNALKYPDWPGLDEFEGPKFHTARWEHEHDLSGKRVAFVGTGCTAAQAVPEIAPIVKQLYLFQREPGHVLPKGARNFTADERAARRGPIASRIERLKCFVETAEVRGTTVPLPGSQLNEKYGKMCLDYIQEIFHDRPDLVEKVTPLYPFYGKRIILADDFYPSLRRDNVELIPKAVERITKNTVVAADGVEREVDVLVIGTGFQPANFLAHLKVVGREGKSIHEVWDGTPRALLGVAVARFPNFYMLYGPNSNGGEILFHEEQQIGYIVRSIKRMIREGVTSLELKQTVMDRFNRWLQSRLESSSFGRRAVGYKLGYYRSPTGTVVTQWNQGLTLFWLLSKILAPFASIAKRHTTPLQHAKGLRNLRTQP